MERTHGELAASLGVGQDTVSRIEPRSDILLLTLRRYVEAMGGEVELVARFPYRPPVTQGSGRQEGDPDRRLVGRQPHGLWPEERGMGARAEREET